METKIENLLKKVEDLQEQNEGPRGKELALEELKAFFLNRRIKTWTEGAELLMKKYLNLAVDLRNTQDLKLGMIQYRNISRLSNSNSLDNLLGLLMDICESQVKTAVINFQNELKKFATLPNELNIILKSSGTTHEERLRKSIVKPWKKFALDCYRIVMETIKYNQSLEKRYHNAAQRAFIFCKNYAEKGEFGSISKTMKIHFDLLNIYTDTNEKAATLTKKTIQYHLDTRFKQLEIAYTLGHFKGAYSIFDDLYKLIKRYDGSQPGAVYVRYYRFLQKLYWVSKNYELHAFTWLRILSWLDGDKNIKKRRACANEVLLAVMAAADDRDVNNNYKKHQRSLSVYAFMNEYITKESLMYDVKNENVLSYADPAVVKLYNIMLNEFNPLEIVANVAAAVENIDPTLKEKYDALIKRAVSTRFIIQIGEVYDNISFEELEACFAGYLTMKDIESVLVTLNERRLVSAVIDHRNKELNFQTGTFAMETESVRDIFYEVVTAIHTSVNLMMGVPTYANELTELYGVVRDNLKDEFEGVNDRLNELTYVEFEDEMYRARLEKKLEKSIELHKKRQEELVKKQQVKEQQKALELRMEAQRRAEERERLTNAYLQLNNNDPTIVVPSDLTMRDIENTIREKQDALANKRRDRERKTTDVIANLDYYERAVREAQVSELDKAHKKRNDKSRKAFEKQLSAAKSQMERQRQKCIESKKLFSPIYDDAETFMENHVMVHRQKELETEMEKYNEAFNERKAAWQERQDMIREEVQRRAERERRQQKLDEYKRREYERKLREREEEEQRRRAEEEKKRKAEGIYVPKWKQGGGSSSRYGFQDDQPSWNRGGGNSRYSDRYSEPRHGGDRFNNRSSRSRFNLDDNDAPPAFGSGRKPQPSSSGGKLWVPSHMRK